MSTRIKPTWSENEPRWGKLVENSDIMSTKPTWSSTRPFLCLRLDLLKTRLFFLCWFFLQSFTFFHKFTIFKNITFFFCNIFFSAISFLNYRIYRKGNIWFSIWIQNSVLLIFVCNFFLLIQYIFFANLD